MKRKALIAVLCMVMSVSIINTGCSGNTSKKEEKHTTETNNKGNKDTEEKTSEKSSEKTEKDTKKNVKYEYGITNLDSVEYVKDPSVPEVGEDGNPMNVPNKIVGLPTLWLEVKPDIEWFKDFQSAPTIMDFSMDVVGYCISDVTKILENFGKKQIRKIFEKQIMKFKKWEKEKEVHTTLSEEYYKQVGLILVAYKIVKKLYGLHTRKNEVIGFISQNITVSWHGKTVEKSNNNIGDSTTWITP